MGISREGVKMWEEKLKEIIRDNPSGTVCEEFFDLNNVQNGLGDLHGSWI